MYVLFCMYERDVETILIQICDLYMINIRNQSVAVIDINIYLSFYLFIRWAYVMAF